MARALVPIDPTILDALDWWRGDVDVCKTLTDEEEHLVSAMLKLSQVERDTLTAVFWERLTFRQIGARDGISKWTVRRTYRRALGKLRHELRSDH